jgi:dihydrofolate synthase/folylpolyglutamate synthase
MDYQETLDYLYAQLPMFTRVGESAYRKDLYNTIALCAAIDNPQHKFKSIHVGGTNGKGSVSHMLAAILQTAGYKTGLYTSPHLKDFRERIRINGQMIPHQNIIHFVEQNQHLFQQLSPSFFEVTVAMAFEYFANEKVDIAIIEVGLGGRLDSTNIIQPVISVVTNIGLDHINILGNTLVEIAREKAGIIKTQTPIIIGEFTDETNQVFLAKADDLDAPITFASQEWKIIVDKLIADNRILELQNLIHQKTIPLNLDLTGTYQIKNVLTVLSAVSEICKKGFIISDDQIQKALSQVKTLTGLNGRWQTLQTQPLVICDTGHNEDGIKEVIKNIKSIVFKNLHIVIGMVNDKDIRKVLSLLPENATYYFCSPNLPRAMPAIELQKQAQEFGLKGDTYHSVSDALNVAKSKADVDDFIFVGGSTFVVAEVV